MRKKKKVIVIGAGIAGLSAAFYSRRNGFEVTVFEQGNCPGGVSTSWNRRGFVFDGGIHWLVGSSPRLQPFYRRWIETGALQANNQVIYPDPVFEFRSGNNTLHLWRNIDHLTEDFLHFAPEDSKAILTLRRHVKFVAFYLIKIRGLSDLIKKIIKLPVFAFLYFHLQRSSTRQYVERFKNPYVREVLSSVINLEQNALSLVGTLAGYHIGDNGFPTGGSLRLAKNMEQTALKAGCKILYQTKVEKICIDNNRVKGVIVKDEMLPADYVIVAMDTCTALREFFDKPLQEKWAKKLAKGIDSEQCSLFSLGVKKDLIHLPSTLRINMKEPVIMAGQEYSTLWVYHYKGQDGYAPEGCSSLTVLFQGDTYDFWKDAKDKGTYRTEKQKFILEAQRLLTYYLPEIEGNIVVTDLATPITYERYCNCFRGGYMNIWHAKQSPFNVPIKSKSVRGLRFAGMRTLMSGGLPISVQSGYRAAKSL